MLNSKKTSLAAFAVLMSMSISSNAATTDSVVFDQVFDNPDRPMTSVACSDGKNGLITRKGWRTLGNAPKSVYVGGAPAVAGWNSPNCGTCWQLTYTDAKKAPKSITVLAVDQSASGFVIGRNAMNTLTGNQAMKLGRVNVQATQIDASKCGI